jgi:dihydroneopterin triphosphate diphosphatase
VAAIVSRVVEVCVFRRLAGVPSYLVLKRSAHDAIYPGIWQMVTGSLKDGETARDGALREFREETGLVPVRFWVVPFVNSFYVPVNDTVHLSPVFAIEARSDALVSLSDEHEEFRWCTLDEAKHALVWPGQRHAVDVVHDHIVGEQESSRLLSLQV